MHLRSTIALSLAASLAAGAFFFWRAPHVWPMADIDLVSGTTEDVTLAREFLLFKLGLDVSEWDCEVSIVRNEKALNESVRVGGQEAVQRALRNGAAILWRRVQCKQQDNPEWIELQVRPGTGVLGFQRKVEDDWSVENSDSVPGDSSVRSRIAAVLPSVLLDPGWTLTDQTSRRLDARSEHSFRYEDSIPGLPGIRRTFTAVVSGSFLLRADGGIEISPELQRRSRARQAWESAVSYGASVLLAIFAFLGLGVAVRTAGAHGELRTAAKATAIAGLGLLATYALDVPRQFAAWDPLWPRWISDFRQVVERLAWDLPMLALVFVFALSGRGLDRDGRSATLFLVLRGRWEDSRIPFDVVRGYLVAFLCGGLLALGNLLLGELPGSHVQLQPQGFFGFSVNSLSPGASTLAFFLAIALVEELGYRLFAGSWFLYARWPSSLRIRMAVAVLVPAAVYGAMHTQLSFLPPLDPWWGRPLLMAVVGTVWGVVFLRYGALTVVVSHWAADLFIFNWPRLCQGGDDRFWAIGTVSIPLLLVLPGLWALKNRGLRVGGKSV